jgi:hypothetical protein
MLGDGWMAGSLGHALANEKTPLRESAPQTPERAQQTGDRSSVARKRVFIGIAAALVVVVGLFLLLGGGDNPVIPIPGIGNETPVPAFAFTKVTTDYEATANGAGQSAQTQTAKDVAPHVEKTIGDLFHAAYLDPGGWGDGGAIEELFTADAAKQIEANIDTLTLGSSAGDTFESVQPARSTLAVTVLTDGQAKPLHAMAAPTFAAIAANDDGTFTRITVTGVFFLIHDGDDWKISAFDLDRTEEPTKAPASASPTASETP